MLSATSPAFRQMAVRSTGSSFKLTKRTPRQKVTPHSSTSCSLSGGHCTYQQGPLLAQNGCKAVVLSIKQGEIPEWWECNMQGEEAGTFRVHGQEHDASKGLPCLDLAGYLEGQLHRNQVAGIPCTNAAMCHPQSFTILSNLCSQMQHDMDVSATATTVVHQDYIHHWKIDIAL